MPAGQRELRLLVTRDGEGGWLEAGCRVTLVALVDVGHGRELPGMRIGMAGGTGQLAGDVCCAPAFGLMASHTGERGMLSFQGESALAVPFEVES